MCRITKPSPRRANVRGPDPEPRSLQQPAACAPGRRRVIRVLRNFRRPSEARKPCSGHQHRARFTHNSTGAPNLRFVGDRLKNSWHLADTGSKSVALEVIAGPFRRAGKRRRPAEVGREPPLHRPALSATPTSDGTDPTDYIPSNHTPSHQTQYERTRTVKQTQTIAVYVDPKPDERGNVLAFAVMTNDRRIALTFNAN
jgi:hypothetical protein